MKKLALFTALLLMAAVATTARPGLSLEEMQPGVFCHGVTGYRALTARIVTEKGHNSAATICYLDNDQSNTFTPQGDTLVFVNNDNDVTGCAACPAP